MMSRKKLVHALIERCGQLFSVELGIDVATQPFRWLLASILLGGRISETISKRTYRAFARRKLLTPRAILGAGWAGLVPVMGEGGYVRYDESTSAYLIGVCRKLIDDYEGKLEALHAAARDPADLERRLLEFPGLGPVRVSIFLRELRGIWKKADPAATEIELRAAHALGLTKTNDPGAAIRRLKAIWNDAAVPGHDFRHFEAALVRKGLELRRTASRSAKPKSATGSGRRHS